MDKLQTKADRKVVHAQNKIEQVQNKAGYKERKVQLKAELKEEKNRNWAGRLAEHAPKSLKQNVIEAAGEPKQLEDHNRSGQD